MNKILQTGLVLSAILAFGCASPYMAHRGRDAGDIFTATIGAGLGAKARVGPVNVGLYLGGDKLGWRGGSVLHCPG